VEGGALMPDCVLCGNTGRTTAGRQRAAELAAALSLLGAALGVVTVVFFGLALLGRWGWRPGAAAALATAAGLLAATAVQWGLARSVPAPDQP